MNALANRSRHMMWCVAVGLTIACQGKVTHTTPAPQSTMRVTIASPHDGHSFERGDSILFAGSAFRGSVAAANDELSWSSSLSGLLGMGGSVTRNDLPLGAHTITLTALMAGAEGSASVQIDIVPIGINAAPVVHIDAPAEDDEHVAGDVVTLNGTAVDPEDGLLPDWALTWTSTVDGLLGTGGTLELSTLSTAVHLVTLTAIDSDGLDGRATVRFAVVPVGQNRLPSVQILSPSNNEVLYDAAAATLTGSASDPEDGVLDGAALTWSSNVDGSLGSGSSAVAALSLGLHILSLTAIDSSGGAGSDDVVVTVAQPGNEAPMVTIVQPANDSTVDFGVELELRGEAVDAEDGPLSATALAWHSSLDGDLGTGSPFSTDNLNIGLHTVILVAADSTGTLGSDTVDIRVLEAVSNQPPVATIVDPAPGSAFDRGDAVTFAGNAVDPEDGNLPGLAMSWSSSLDGALGTGESLTLNTLSEGAHTVRLTAIDSRAAIGQDEVNITIHPGTVENLAPTARIAVPVQAMARTAVVFDGSTSTDADGTITRYVFDAGDGSTAYDGSSSSVEHVYASEGSYNVSLTVFDDDGASGHVAAEIAVTPFVRSPVVVEDVRDGLGYTCSLAFLPSELAVIAYRNATHDQLKVARQLPDGDFAIEVVEGLGIDLGGASGKSNTMAIDSAGVVHVAHLLTLASGELRLHYSRFAGSSWSYVDLGPASAGHFPRGVDLTLNPTNNEMPEIIYRGGDGRSLQWAHCNSDCDHHGNWAIDTLYTETRSEFGVEDDGVFVGELAVSSGGTRYISASFVFRQDDPNSSYDAWMTEMVVLIDHGSGFFAETVVPLYRAATSYSVYEPRDWNFSRIALDTTDQPLLAHPEGIYHRLAANDWSLSSVEHGTLNNFAVAFDAAADTAYVLHRHGGNLELIGENERSFWLYRDLGPEDDAWPDLELDPRGEPRACFFRSNNLLLF